MKLMIPMVLIFAVALLFPSLSSAQTTYTRVPGYACNGCTYAQYEQKAIAHGAGNHLVYDFTNDQLHYFRVTRELVDRYGGGYIYDATEITVPVDLQSYFERARSVWAENGKNAESAMAVVQVPVSQLKGLPSRDLGEDAYAVVETSAFQNDISDCLAAACWLASGQHDWATENIVSLLQDTLGILFDDNATQVIITVVMDNGSKITFIWKNGQNRPQFISARDVNNNTIPLQPANVGANGPLYNFQQYHPDLQSFTNLMNMYGVPITTSGSVWEEACVIVGDGTKVCHAWPQ